MASLGEPVRLERGKVNWFTIVSLQLFVVISLALANSCFFSRDVLYNLHTLLFISRVVHLSNRVSIFIILFITVADKI